MPSPFTSPTTKLRVTRLFKSPILGCAVNTPVVDIDTQNIESSNGDTMMSPSTMARASTPVAEMDTVVTVDVVESPLFNHT